MFINKTSPFIETSGRTSIRLLDNVLSQNNGDIESSLIYMLESGFFDKNHMHLPTYVLGTGLDTPEASLIAQGIMKSHREYSSNPNLEDFIMMTSDDLDLIKFDEYGDHFSSNSDGVRANKHQPKERIDLMFRSSERLSDDWLLYNSSFNLSWASAQDGVILVPDEFSGSANGRLEGDIVKSPCIDLALLNTIFTHEPHKFPLMILKNKFLTKEIVFGSVKKLYMDDGNFNYLDYLVYVLYLVESSKHKASILKFCLDKFDNDEFLLKLNHTIGYKRCLQWSLPDFESKDVDLTFVQDILVESLSGSREDLPSFETTVLELSGL